MRKRWAWQWRPYWGLIWTAWVVIGLVIWALMSAVTNHGEVSNITGIVYGVGALVVPSLVGVIVSLRWLWRNPPIKRITESVEDMEGALQRCLTMISKYGGQATRWV